VIHPSRLNKQSSVKLAKLTAFIAGANLCVSLGTSRAQDFSVGQGLFVANGDNNTIVRFDASGVGTLFASSGLSGPFGVAFDKGGNLYVANSYSGLTGYSIEKFAPSGVGTVFFGPSADLGMPTGLAFDAAGNLYVANAQLNTILKLNPAGAGTIFANSGLNFPTALAFDGAGNLYVANGNSFNILKFNPAGVSTVFASSGLNSPTGMAFDAAGNLFVANQNGIIEKFNSSGVGTAFTTLPPGVTPVCLAFDGNGDLFATTSHDTIMKFSPSGIGTIFASSGMAVPNGLAFQPVPEPPASALVAAGLSCALLAMHRRRASAM
jgi:sugar lactone lactonase YvrE